MPLDPNLTALELDVIAALAGSRVTASSVTLAADVWRTNENWATGDVVGIVTLVVHSLGEQGLVQYVERAGHPFPCDIRLSPDGWALAGFPNQIMVVGTPSRHRNTGRHPHDATEYRNHGYRAEASPITKEDFETHYRHFPHHIHDYGKDFTMLHPSNLDLADPEGTGDKRTYVRITPDLEARVISARTKLGTVTYNEIAEYTGVPERTVRYILTELPRLRRTRSGEGEPNDASLRDRILATLQVLEHVKDVADLQRILGRADDKHNIVHVLHSLHSGGLIDFREAAGREYPTDIVIRKKGSKKRVLPHDEAVLADLSIEVHSDDPRVRAADPETLVQDMDFPLLAELLAREAKRQTGDETALAYIAAANAIEKIDPDAARSLMDKAEANNVPFPSPIEQEYLRYAATHTESET